MLKSIFCSVISANVDTPDDGYPAGKDTQPKQTKAVCLKVKLALKIEEGKARVTFD